MAPRALQVNEVRLLLIAILASTLVFIAGLAVSEPASASLGSFCRHGSQQHYHWWGYNTSFYHSGWRGKLGKHYHTYEVHYFSYTNNYHEVRYETNRCPRH